MLFRSNNQDIQDQKNILTSSMLVLFFGNLCSFFIPSQKGIWMSICISHKFGKNCNYNDCFQTGSLNSPIFHWLFKQIIILMDCRQIYFLQNNQALNRYQCSILLEFTWNSAPNDRHQKWMLIHYMIKRMFLCKILLYESLGCKKCFVIALKWTILLHSLR